MLKFGKVNPEIVPSPFFLPLLCESGPATGQLQLRLGRVPGTDYLGPAFQIFV
jgi:hypothetical protein